MGASRGRLTPAALVTCRVPRAGCDVQPGPRAAQYPQPVARSPQPDPPVFSPRSHFRRSRSLHSHDFRSSADCSPESYRFSLHSKPRVSKIVNGKDRSNRPARSVFDASHLNPFVDAGRCGGRPAHLPRARHRPGRAARHRRHRRRRRIVPDARDGPAGRRPGRHAEGAGAVHRVRADRRGVREAARRHGREPAEAGEPGPAPRHPHVSRGGGQGDGSRRGEAEEGEDRRGTVGADHGARRHGDGG